MRAAIFGAILSWASLPSFGATLLGDATLYSPNDLTVVADGNTTFQFFDLTASYGLSVSTAVATYQNAGFRWATAADMAALLSAFNISYAIAPGDSVYLQPADGTQWNYQTFSNATWSFLNHVGYDPAGAISAAYYAAGFIADLPTAGHSTYLYINPSAGLAFVSNA